MNLLSITMTDLWPLIAIAGFTLVTIAMKWIAQQKWADTGVRDFTIYIEGFGARARDKFLAELEESKLANSDGGIEVTSDELSKIRSDMYALLMSEIKGPAKDYAIQLGEHVIKGLIGKFLNKS